MITKTETDRPPKDYRFGYRLYLVLAALSLMGAALCIFLLKWNTAPAGRDGSPVMEILNTASGKVYSRRSMDAGGEFAIEFVHSVHNSPVRETFKVQSAAPFGTWEILPVAVRFYSFGAGMQAELEEGQQLSRDNDAMVISGFDRAFSELNYIVGTVSDHLLLVSGQTVSLRNLCGKNARVTIRIK